VLRSRETLDVDDLGDQDGGAGRADARDGGQLLMARGRQVGEGSLEQA
jgi:hypothetical protein